MDVYPEADKLGKQFKYASAATHARSSPSSATTSATNGSVSIKDLRSGAQETVPRAGAAAYVEARMHPEPGT